MLISPANELPPSNVSRLLVDVFPMNPPTNILSFALIFIVVLQTTLSKERSLPDVQVAAKAPTAISPTFVSTLIVPPMVKFLGAAITSSEKAKLLMTINAAVARIVVTDLSFAVPCSVRFSDRERQLMVVAINGIGSSFIVVGRPHA